VRKDADGAEAAFREAVRLQPTNSDAWTNLGYLLQHERKDVAGAEQCYKSAIHFNPDNGIAHYNLGFLHEKEQHDLAAAELEYKQALRCNLDDVDAQCRLAKVVAATAAAAQSSEGANQL
jgi:tetratricopeptide (TPR) repeat protein